MPHARELDAGVLTACGFNAKQDSLVQPLTLNQPVAEELSADYLLD